MEIFRPMQCRDISTGGVSFFWTAQPNYDEIVVEMGKPPAFSYFKAKIVGADLTNPDLPDFLIRCQFTGRVF